MLGLFKRYNFKITTTPLHNFNYTIKFIMINQLSMNSHLASAFYPLANFNIPLLYSGNISFTFEKKKEKKITFGNFSFTFLEI